MAALSEWLQLMLAEIERKREEERAQRAVPATPAATMPDEERARSAPSH